MRWRVVGWVVSLGTLVAGATFAAVVRSLNEENRRRTVDSAQLLRDRAAASMVQLRDRTVETARDLREQWTGTALQVRDRWTTTAEEVRARAVDTAEDWRERSSEGFERRLRQAAEARDESLAALDDDEDESGAPAAGSSGVEVGALFPWIAAQRWFANSGGDALSLRAALPLTVDGTVRTLIVRDATCGAEAVYQVPVATGSDGSAGSVPGSEPALVDGPRSPAFVEALLGLLFGGTAAGTDGTGAEGVLLGWAGPPPRLRSARVLSGEQSNTSVIVEAERVDGSPVALMVKVFRALHDGENPDVVLQSAIAAAGSRRVPATYAALVGRWPDPAVPSGTARGHLAVAQEFLADTRDAWRVALDAARAGEDFAERARDLGAATAEVHGVLAAVLPTAVPDDGAREAALVSMRSRAAQAASLVPSLASSGDRIAAVLEAGVAGEWPVLQRVHGDYHLGQVLQVPDRGWVLLDFEGEPLRPMAERSRPDLALRDVAGMLRSFDYVAGTLAHEGGDAEAARAWSDRARTAFLAGYEAELRISLAPWSALLAALELDKALYECVYEARNRPTWLAIPELAVQRLLEAVA